MINWNPLLTLKDVEKEVLRQAITHHSGNLKAVSEDLDIGYEGLRKRFKKLFTEEERLILKPVRKWWE